MKDIQEMLDRIKWQNKLLEEVEDRLNYANSNDDVGQVMIWGGVRYYLMKGFISEQDYDKED